MTRKPGRAMTGGAMMSQDGSGGWRTKMGHGGAGGTRKKHENPGDAKTNNEAHGEP